MIKSNMTGASGVKVRCVGQKMVCATGTERRTHTCPTSSDFHVPITTTINDARVVGVHPCPNSVVVGGSDIDKNLRVEVETVQ